MNKTITIKYNIKITNNLHYIFFNVEGEVNEPSRTYKASDIFTYDSSDYNSVCDCIEKMAQTFDQRAERSGGLYETVEITIDEFRIAGENGENDKVFNDVDIKDLKFSMELFDAMLA